MLIWFAALGLIRFAQCLASKALALARDELGAALAAAGCGRWVRATRRRLAQHTKVPASALRCLYATVVEICEVRCDRTHQEHEHRICTAVPSEFELRELTVLARSRRRALSVVMVLVLAPSIYGLSRLLLTRPITGGVLLLFSGGWCQMWGSAWSTWIVIADGYSGGVTPLLGILALPAALGRLVGLGTSALISALALLAMPLAVLGAWFVAGMMVRKVVLRAWAAPVWALSPSLLSALGQGRLGALLVHLVLPQALLAPARVVGTDRRDLVLSGLVGARLLIDGERVELDRFPTEKVTDLVHLDEEVQAESKTEDTEDTEDTDDAAATEDTTDTVYVVHAVEVEGDTAGDAEPAQDGEADTTSARKDTSDNEDYDCGEDEAKTGPAVRAPAAREPEINSPPTEEYGHRLTMTAAIAGLLPSVVVAVVSATAAMLVAIILLLSVTTRHGFKPILTLVPMSVTVAPAWWGVWLLGHRAGWAEGARLLLTDISLPVSVPAPSSLDLLVGSPMDLDAPVFSGALSVLLRVLLALVSVLGTVGLFVFRHVRVAHIGILLALGSLILAGLCLHTLTGLGPDVVGSDLAPVNGWSGAGLSLVLSSFLAAALTAGETIWGLLGQRSRGGRRALERRSRKDADATSSLAADPTVRRKRSCRLKVTFTIAACLVLLAPVVTGDIWFYQAHRASNPQVLALHSTPQQIPFIAEQLQGLEATGRALRLTSTSQGLQTIIWRGFGTQISDVLPGAVNVEACIRAVAILADPGLKPGRDTQSARPSGTASGQAFVSDDPADVESAQIVTCAVAGQGKGVADALAAHGIAVVVLDHQESDAATVEARVGLVSMPGLEQLAQTASGNSWRVTSSAHPDSARLSLLGAGGVATPVTSIGTGSETRTEIPAGAGPRTLVMAKRSDAGWSATLDGRRLEATTVRAQDSSWKQGLTVGSKGGKLVVTHTRRSTAAVIYTIRVVQALTLVAALPL